MEALKKVQADIQNGQYHHCFRVHHPPVVAKYIIIASKTWSLLPNAFWLQMVFKRPWKSNSGEQPSYMSLILASDWMLLACICTHSSYPMNWTPDYTGRLILLTWGRFALQHWSHWSDNCGIKTSWPWQLQWRFLHYSERKSAARWEQKWTHRYNW